MAALHLQYILLHFYHVKPLYRPFYTTAYVHSWLHNCVCVVDAQGEQQIALLLVTKYQFVENLCAFVK